LTVFTEFHRSEISGADCESLFGSIVVGFLEDYFTVTLEGNNGISDPLAIGRNLETSIRHEFPGRDIFPIDGLGSDFLREGQERNHAKKPE